MTTHSLDRRGRSAQIIPIAAIAAGVAIVAVVAFAVFGGGGGGRGTNNGGVGIPQPSDRPSAPPDPTAVPTPAPIATPAPTNPVGAPIRFQLPNATGAEVWIDILDEIGFLAGARPGTPGGGMSVEPNTVKVENLDATTLKLTWVDYPIDNELDLYIEKFEGRIRFLLVQPEPSGPTDSIGFDRELILSSSQPTSADEVDAVLSVGLDTPG
jgi:hypothetical protein